MPYVITKMQIKTIMKYHYIPIRMTKIQKTDNTKCQGDVDPQALLFITGENAK